MINFSGSNILSVTQFQKKDIDHILSVADDMLPYASGQETTKVLDGAVLANLFFEPSTRTRISFNTAFLRLGGQVTETVGVSNSSLTKGESISDTAKVISSYVDAIAIRHAQKGIVPKFAAASLVPVINGGDGADEHPTQALLDLYTLKRELGTFDHITIAMVGDLKYGRTVHSLAKLLAEYNQNITFQFVAPPELQMPQDIQDYILAKNKQHKIETTSDLITSINQAAVIYSTRVQEERFSSPESYEQFRGKYRLNKNIIETHSPKALILHPLPRDSREGSQELNIDLDQLPNLAIFRQAYNGLPLRMALFALVLGVEKKIANTAKKSNWYINKNF